MNTKKIKYIFIAIFVAIAIPVIVLLERSYSHLQMVAQYGDKERAFSLMQTLNQRIRADLTVEDRRSYSDYRFIRTIPVLGGEEVTISPLASPAFKNQYAGFVGYFQLFADSSVQTPILPDGYLEEIPMADRPARELKRDSLKMILNQMNIRVQAPPEHSFDADSSSSVLNKIYKQNLTLDRKKIVEKQNTFVTRIEESSQKERFIFDVESAKIQRLGVNNHLAVVQTEPFQAVYNQSYIVFYRNVTRSGECFIQGYIVRFREYFSSIIEDDEFKMQLGDNAFVEFSIANAAYRSYAVFGNRPATSRLLFESPLQYPFEDLQFKVYLTNVRSSPGENMVLLIGLIMFVILGGGLYGLYRVMTSQVELSFKRQNFISAVSHELKTPLTAIRMYAEMLQNSWAASEEKKHKYYDLIASETERLSRLIQNVLNLSKLDRNRWNVQVQDDNPKRVLESFVAMYSKNIENHGFDLTVSCDPCNMMIPMDKDAVMQILMNLVDNSLKFAANAGYKMIELKLSVKEDDIFFSVRDYGPGIQQKEMNKVFEEFYRVENEMTRTTKGTGIGLSMVKKLCNLTNMKIELENANPGLRTKIHFTSISNKK